MRILLALLLYSTPLFADRIPVPIIPIALGAILAYDMLDGRTIFWTGLFLVLLELSWGVSLGVLSLSYLFVVLLLMMMQRFVAIIPLSREQGWSVVPFFKSVLLASVLALALQLAATGVQRLLYHQGSVQTPMLLTVVLLEILILGIVHRIDVPFRRQIRFG